LWRFIKIDVSKTILIHAVKLEERTKILYIIPKLVNAGAEKHLVNLVKNLDKGKFEALICCVKELGILGETIKYSGVNVICLNRKSIYDLRIIIDIFKLIKKNRFDIVHSYLFGFDYLACLPAKLLRVPLVISSRRELASWKKLHHHFLGNLGNLFTDKVIANSEAAKNFALKNEILRPEKITTIYNGINLNEFLPFPKNKQVLSELGFVDGDIIVGMVTKFAEVKDVLTALKAMAQVRKPYPNTKYLLVGDGSLRKDMEAKARDLKLNGNIKFVGARPDIPQILSIIDIFILTSLSESLPNSVLEAMACEKPVVCTEVGGIPEVVLNAENGILARPKDYQDIAKAVINLIEKESLRNRMGVLGRKTVKERFSLERMVKEYDAFYTFAARKLHP
jgi:glycosyltransferase involved in cell wall biosynthesis